MRSILLLILITFSHSAHIELHTHDWCPHCLKVQKVVQKISLNFAELGVAVYQHHGNQSMTLHNLTKILPESNVSNLTQSMPFPTIFLHCGHSNTSSVYQFDPTYTELHYWVSILCRRSIPMCSSQLNKTAEYIFPVDQRLSSITHRQVQWIHRHSFLKVCVSVSTQISTHSQLPKQDLELPLYFSRFSHGARDYLARTGHLAIILFSKVTNPRVSAFQNVFSSLLNNNHRNWLKRYHSPNETFLAKQPHRYGYSLPSNETSSLVFLSLSVCSEGSQHCAGKNQGVRQSALVKRLLDFLDEQPFITEEASTKVMSFRFSNGTIDKNTYQHVSLDHSFLFWIHQMLVAVPKREAGRVCLANQLIDRFCKVNLKDIQQNVSIRKEIKQLESILKQKVQVNSIGRRIPHSPRFSLCIREHQPYKSDTFSDIRQALWKGLQKQNDAGYDQL